MTTHEEIRVVSAAIEKADLKALRSVLKSMCESSEECRKEAAQRLLLSVPTGSNKRKSEQSPQEAEDASDNKKAKTVVSRFEKCITCKKVFDVTTNRDDSCQTHSDILELDYDMFPDDDEVADGAVDPYTDWRRKECPEGFIWQCCERNIRQKPCVIQKHMASELDEAKSSEGTDEESPIEISSDEE